LEVAVIRLAGDGSSFVFSPDDTNSFSLFGPDPGLKLGSAVSALPVTDQIPQVKRGHLSSGQVIVLASDGIGDFIRQEESWLFEFRDVLLSENTVMQSLVGLVDDRKSSSMDDKSFVWVKFN
jgi:hypothetical protein